jgi:hypothetical protein
MASSPLVSRPGFKFKLQPKFKEGLLKLQNDHVIKSSGADITDFGMPVKKQTPFFVNSYVNSPTAPSIALFNTTPKGETTRKTSHLFTVPAAADLSKIFAVALVGGAAVFWTYKLLMIKRRPSNRDNE